MFLGYYHSFATKKHTTMPYSTGKSVAMSVHFLLWVSLYIV